MTSRIALQVSGALRPAAWKTVLGLADQAVVSGTSFVTMVLVGRTCGPDELGIYALAFTLVLFAICVQDSLITSPYTVYASRLPEADRRAYAGSVLAQHGLLSGLIVICLGALGGLLAAGIGPIGWRPVVWALTIAIPLALLRELNRRLAFAHLQIVGALWFDVIVALLQVTATAALAWAGLLSAASAYAALGLACGVASFGWLVLRRKAFSPCWRRASEDLRRNWSFGRWVLAGQLTSQGNEYGVQWILALVLGTAPIGALAACSTVVGLANPLVIGIGNVLSPTVALAFAQQGYFGAHRVVSRTTWFLGAALGAFCGGVFVFGGTLMSWLYGNQYAGYQHLLMVLALAVLIGAMGVGPENGLRAADRPDLNFKVSLLGLAVTIAVVSLLVSDWGVLGAAYGYLISAAVRSTIRWGVFTRLARGPEVAFDLGLTETP